MAYRYEATSIEGVWVYEAPVPGETAVVIGGVHGDERAGVRTIQELLEDRGKPPVEQGQLYLVIGNLLCLADSVDGAPGARFWQANMNRCFRELNETESQEDPKELPYELRRAQELRGVLDEAHYSLDIHQFSDPRSQPFMISDSRRGIEIVQGIGLVDIISAGWAQTEPGSTDEYMYRNGNVGICLEAGQKADIQGSVDWSHASVDRFLQQAGLREKHAASSEVSDPVLIRNKRTIYRSAETFAMLDTFRHFERLQHDLPIALDGDTVQWGRAGEVVIFPPYPVNADVPVGAEICSLGVMCDSVEQLLSEASVQ